MNSKAHLSLAVDISQQEEQRVPKEYSFLLAAKPNLRACLGTGTYGTVLELECGDKATFHILNQRTTGLYIGFSTSTQTVARMKEYLDEERMGGRPVRESRFFTGGVERLSDNRSVIFDLILASSLRYLLTSKTEERFKLLIAKLLRHAKKLVLHTILSEDLGEHGTVKASVASLSHTSLFQVSTSFFSLTLYQGIATLSGRKLTVHHGEVFEYRGVTFETKYLVFE